MDEQPTPTPEEQDAGAERQADEEAMRYPGHEDPQRETEEPQEDSEIHDA